MFSNSRVVYLVKNHYENYSPQMIPTNPTGSWPNKAAQEALCEIYKLSRK